MASSRIILLTARLLWLGSLYGSLAQEGGCRIPACCDEDCCGLGSSWNGTVCITNSSSPGFVGTYSDDYQVGCLKRQCCESDCCSEGTMFDGALECIVGPPTTPACAPTTGPCSSNDTNLRNALNTAGPDDVISVCGGSEVGLGVSESLIMAQPNMTLCCETQDCRLSATAGVSILRVTGESATISNIDFQGGGDSMRGDSMRGGNLGIEADGDHLIEDCNFDASQGDSNPTSNVFIRTLGTLTVRRSSFTNGIDATGLEVEDASRVVVEDTEFRGNGRMGFLVQWRPWVSNLRDLNTMGLDVSITNSSFIGNGEFAGTYGFLASNMGTMPRLEIKLSTFSDNAGGAASLCCSEEFGNVELSGNSGSNNGGANREDLCNDFLFYESALGCVRLDKELP